MLPGESTNNIYFFNSRKSINAKTRLHLYFLTHKPKSHLCLPFVKLINANCIIKKQQQGLKIKFLHANPFRFLIYGPLCLVTHILFHPLWQHLLLFFHFNLYIIHISFQILKKRWLKIVKPTQISWQIFNLFINNNPAENSFMPLQCLQADCDYHHHLIFNKIFDKIN